MLTQLQKQNVTDCLSEQRRLSVLAFFFLFRLVKTEGQQSLYDSVL